MGFLDRFRAKKDSTPQIDPLADLVLAKLRVGYLVDYDLRTWVVKAYNRYRFNDGRTSEEWELEASRDRRYLERADDQGEVWTLCQNIPIGAISASEASSASGGEVRKHILEHDDPPDRVTYRGTTYYLEGSIGGYQIPGGDGPQQEMIQWEFVDEAEDSFLTIAQWSETELTAVCGIFVEEYQFTNILPGEPQ